MKGLKIGLALSGGGSRAIAFHLGCLRSLNDLGVLDDIEVISTVSGGSVIGALYTLHRGSFAEFDRRIQQLLSRGFVLRVICKAFTTTEGLKSLICWMALFSFNTILIVLSIVIWLIYLPFPKNQSRKIQTDHLILLLRRVVSKTTIMQLVFDDLFEGASFQDLPDDGPLLIINSTELRTGSAFYFSRLESGSWRLNKLADGNISLAKAVTASAAFPFLLPALDEVLPFRNADGMIYSKRVLLTDGGVYDNLGLSPLWPDRDPEVSLNVMEVDYIISCHAGYGTTLDFPRHSLFSQLHRVFNCIHDRTQNFAKKRLFDLKNSGQLKGFIHPFLGQNDNRLKFLPTDLVSREETYAYPTNFSAMSNEWIEKLTCRGSQLTKALIKEHYPDIVRNCGDSKMDHHL